MSHANAAPGPIQRLRIGRLIVEEEWPVAHAALSFQSPGRPRNGGLSSTRRWASRGCRTGLRACTGRRTEEPPAHKRSPFEIALPASLRSLPKPAGADAGDEAASRPAPTPAVQVQMLLGAALSFWGRDPAAR